jgi:hypothetical protein
MVGMGQIYRMSPHLGDHGKGAETVGMGTAAGLNLALRRNDTALKPLGYSNRCRDGARYRAHRHDSPALSPQ